ncbi:MAG: hypothetical protein ACJ8M1_09340 [Chthoniobacterales bacterium]|jgi:hypothetical protein
MQTKTGDTLGNTTAHVINGSNVVDAAAGCDWSDVEVGSWFTKPGSFAIYLVAAPPGIVGGVWRALLTANYAGVTDAATAFVFHTSFGPNGEPIFHVGDTEVLPILNRFMANMAENIASGGGGGGGGETFNNMRKSPTTNKTQWFNAAQNKWFDVDVVGQAGLETLEVTGVGEAT